MVSFPAGTAPNWKCSQLGQFPTGTVSNWNSTQVGQLSPWTAKCCQYRHCMIFGFFVFQEMVMWWTLSTILSHPHALALIFFLTDDALGGPAAVPVVMLSVALCGGHGPSRSMLISCLVGTHCLPGLGFCPICISWCCSDPMSCSVAFFFS